MIKEEARNYLRSSGFSDEQIKDIKDAFMDRERIEYMIRSYQGAAEKYEEDCKNAENRFCNSYAQGKLSAYLEVIDELKEVLEDE